MNQRVSSDFICESCAAITEHAPLTVEHDERRDIDWLFVVAFFFDVSALARTVAERLVLKWAFATFVAHRAIERVVCKQQLEDSLLCLLSCVRFGVDRHAR